MTTEAFNRKLFSELKLVTDNLLLIYAAANWEATESKTFYELATVKMYDSSQIVSSQNSTLHLC